MGSWALALAPVILGLAFAASADGRQLQRRDGGWDMSMQQSTQALREDITNPSIKKSFVGKFNKVKREHRAKKHEEMKKSSSAKSLHKKKDLLADELTSSGHIAQPPPQDEAVKFMAWLPWILPIVCLTILVVVGVGAKMCQKGNYKHTESLREGGVQPTLKYGGPIGRTM